MLAVVVGVEVGELDGVLDGLDLGGEPADVLVVDVGHFLEREVFHLALGQLLEEVAALAVHEDVVADLELDGAEGIGHDADLVLVGPEGDDGAALLEHLLEDDHVPLNFVARHLDHVEPLVEHELLPGLEGLRLDRGMQVDLHLAELLVLVAEVSLDFLYLDVRLSDAVELLHGSFLPWSQVWLLDSTNLLLLF